MPLMFLKQSKIRNSLLTYISFTFSSHILPNAGVTQLFSVIWKVLTNTQIHFVNFRELNDHLFGKELFIRFTASAFRKLPSIYVFSYFHFGFEGRMWDLIVSVLDHCLSFYFELVYIYHWNEISEVDC